MMDNAWLKENGCGAAALPNCVYSTKQ